MSGLRSSQGHLTRHLTMHNEIRLQDEAEVGSKSLILCNLTLGVWNEQLIVDRQSLLIYCYMYMSNVSNPHES